MQQRHIDINIIKNLSKLDLTTNEFKIILYIISLICGEHTLLSLSKSQMSKDLNIKKTIINKNIKTLKEKNIL